MDDDPLLEYLGWVRPRWHADAACKEHPELTWFPNTQQEVARLRPICAACLVRDACAEAGAREEHGIWAGTSPTERRTHRRAA